MQDMCAAMRQEEGRWLVSTCGAERYPICMTYTSASTRICILAHYTSKSTFLGTYE